MIMIAERETRIIFGTLYKILYNKETDVWWRGTDDFLLTLIIMTIPISIPYCRSIIIIIVVIMTCNNNDISLHILPVSLGLGDRIVRQIHPRKDVFPSIFLFFTVPPTYILWQSIFFSYSATMHSMPNNLRILRKMLQHFSHWFKTLWMVHHP